MFLSLQLKSIYKIFALFSRILNKNIFFSVNFSLPLLAITYFLAFQTQPTFLRQ
jgi:hypothetical protein